VRFPPSDGRRQADEVCRHPIAGRARDREPFRGSAAADTVLPGLLEPNLFGLAYFKVTDVDNGPAGSNLDTGAVEGSNTPADCTTPTFGSIGPLTSGDLAVTDSPPPPGTTRQCLSGGYQAYGFANPGRCIAYVRAGRLAAGHAQGAR